LTKKRKTLALKEVGTIFSCNVGDKTSFNMNFKFSFIETMIIQQIFQTICCNKCLNSTFENSIVVKFVHFVCDQHLGVKKIFKVEKTQRWGYFKDYFNNPNPFST
jgi:hypothetical protein